MLKKTMGLLLVLILFIMTGCRIGDNKVSFKDGILENKIRTLINKPNGDLYEGDLLNITKLDLKESKIVSIEGIEYIPSLAELDLSINNVMNIEPLEKLTGLKVLSLRANDIMNIEPLSKLTKLQVLNLEYNKISDIEPLRQLSSLEDLNLGDNEISNVEPLKDLKKIKALYLSDNKVDDVKVLFPLRNSLEKTDFLLISKEQAQEILKGELKKQLNWNVDEGYDLEVFGYESNLDLGGYYYSLELYQIVIDDPVTQEGHGVMQGAFVVNAINGKAYFHDLQNDVIKPVKEVIHQYD